MHKSSTYLTYGSQGRLLTQHAGTHTSDCDTAHTLTLAPAVCVSGSEPELCARCQHSVEHLSTSQQGKHTSVFPMHKDTHKHTQVQRQLPGAVGNNTYAQTAFGLEQMAFQMSESLKCIFIQHKHRDAKQLVML